MTNARTDRSLRLLGRLFLRGEIEALTGLHIGGSAGALAIGNVDQPVIRNPYTNQPYIPGSSLKGKLRSLLERQRGSPQTQDIRRGFVTIHNCLTESEYSACPVCNVFGLPASDWNLPTRLAVRDVALTEASVEALRDAHTDLPFTEIKWEAAIDRLTAAASPRQLERVPAGARFGPMEMVFSIYRDADLGFFAEFVTAMQLLEDDYLGGQGTRGSGRIRFAGLSLSLRVGSNYDELQQFGEPVDGVENLIRQEVAISSWIRQALA